MENRAPDRAEGGSVATSADPFATDFVSRLCREVALPGRREKMTRCARPCAEDAVDMIARVERKREAPGLASTA